MYRIDYLRGKKFIGSSDVEYNTPEDALDAIQDHDIWNSSSKYRIVDTATGDIEEEDDFEDGSGINGMMFPDRDSQEGFDANDFLDRD